MHIGRGSYLLRSTVVMVVSFFILPGNAQEAATPERPIHNTTVFVEAWGDGVYNSLNITRTAGCLSVPGP